MSKKVKQTLTGAMAAMMATGVVATPVMAATTDVDALYKAAYTATIKALSEKTQAAVNEARTAIKALPANLESAIGEFSKQVDTVQHPILVNILAAIKVAETTPNQANVNAAKKAIPAELVPQWKNSYSAAVDAIQQGLINKAVDAIKLAETSKTEENLKAAKDLVADLLTADSEGIKNAVKPLQTRVDAIKLYDFDVTEVSVSKTGVTVAFAALEEDVKDATLDVVDNKGNKVEVVSKAALLKGETGYTFRFKNSLTDRPEGTWSVNGVKVNLDKINLVNDALNANTAEKLYTILDESGLIEGLVDDLANQNAYYEKLSKLADENKVKTVEDIQKAVDLGNEAVGSTVTVSDLVTAAQKATLNKFTELLNKVKLERVNSQWVSSYKTSIKALYSSDLTNLTLSDVQEKIDDSNKTLVKNVVDDATTIEKIQKAIDVVEAYTLVTNDAEAKAKADLVKELNTNLAILNINKSDTKNELKAALKSLETAIADKNIFDYEKEVNEDLLHVYVSKNAGNYTSYTLVKAFLVNAKNDAISGTGYKDTNNVVVKNAITLVKDAATSLNTTPGNQTYKDNLLSALNTLGKYTAKESTNSKFDYSKVNANLLVNYASLLKDISSTGATTVSTDVTAVNNAIKTANNKIVDSLFNDSTDPTNPVSATNLLDKLRSPQLGLTNVVEANRTAYITELARFQGFTTSSTVGNVKTLVDSINNLETIKKSSDVATVKTALTTIAVNNIVTLTGFVELSDANRSDIAELLIDLLDDGTIKDANSSTPLLTGTVIDLATLATQVDAVNGVRENLLLAINNDADDNGIIDDSEILTLTTSATIEALNNISDDFAELTSAQKVSVAQSFNAKRPTKVFDAGTSKEDTKTLTFKSLTEVRNLVSKVKTDLGL